jgi:hypothetical protein
VEIRLKGYKYFEIERDLYHRQGNEQKKVAAGADTGIQLRRRT